MNSLDRWDHFDPEKDQRSLVRDENGRILYCNKANGKRNYRPIESYVEPHE